MSDDEKNKEPQLDLIFNLEEGERLKERGINLAQLKRRDLVEIAREIAVRLALSRLSLEVTCDDVRAEMMRQGYDPALLGMAWGSVFRDRLSWRHMGYTKTQRVSSHARPIGRWRLNI